MLAALFLAAATAAPFPAPATYAYSAVMAGQPVGQWSVAVTRDGAQTQLHESSAASLAGIAVSATADLLLDGDLSPLRYTGRYQTPGEPVTTNVTITPQGATASSSLTGATTALSLVAGTDHFIVVEPGLLAGLFALPAQLGAWHESSLTWVTPTTAQAQLLQIGGPPAPPRPASVPSKDGVVAIAQPIAVTIWYDPATLIPDRIEVPSQNAVLTRLR